LGDLELDECVSCGTGLMSVSDICPRCGWPESKPIKPAEPEEVPEVGSSSDLVKCHLCDLQIELDEKSLRKKNFWFHDKCFKKIPI